MTTSLLSLAAGLVRINGLPAHPLIVHGAVVFGPLAALGALAYLVPGWRQRLRWPVLVAALLAFVFIWAAYFSGDDFKQSNAFLQANKQVERHEDLAVVLTWVTTGFAAVSIVVLGWLHTRRSTARAVGMGLMAVLAVVTLVYVVLTGDAGAKAVYGTA